MRLRALGFGLLALVLLVATGCGSKGNPLAECIDHRNLAMHIHPQLLIAVDGKTARIPAGVGIAGSCLRPLHTHDDSGTIHVEYKRWHDFTLGDFLSVWEDNPYKGMAPVQVTVDGQAHEGDYRSIVLRDGQRIVLRFGSGR